MEFFERYKRIFYAIGFLIVCVALGYLLYRVFFRSLITPAPAGPAPVTDQGAGFPNAGSGTAAISGQNGDSGLPPDVIPAIPGTQIDTVARGGTTETIAVTDGPGFSPTIADNGQDVQFYDPQSGQFFRVDKDGALAALSDKTFPDVQDVTWSPTKNTAVIEFPDGANILYDFDMEKQQTLPKHWEDFAFSPDGNQLILKSMGLDPDNRYLVIANTDGTQVTPLEHLGSKDDTVYPAWSAQNQIVAMFTEGRDMDRQEVYFVGKNGENFKSTTVEGRDFRPQWYPNGDKLLYSVYSSDNGYKPQLWTVNAQGDEIGTERKTLGLETWADKCAFGPQSELYCAVPERLEEGAGIFPQTAEGTRDLLYRIDPQTGAKSLIAIPEGDFSMQNLSVTENGYYLYFTDNATDRIRRIKLR